MGMLFTHVDAMPDVQFGLIFIGLIAIAYAAEWIFNRWISGRWPW